MKAFPTTFPARLGGALVFGAAMAGAAFGQGMLEVARSQLAAGLTEDARVLVESQLNSGSGGQPQKEEARCLQAILTAGADSAALRLEDLLARAGVPAGLRVQARERLGDLAFVRGRYEDAARHWQSAAGENPAIETRQRLLVKTARAQLRLSHPYEALTPLREALELGETPQSGMLRYWRGVAKEAVGDPEGASGDYLAAYTHPEQGYSLAALRRLIKVYGNGKDKTALQWRQRWEDSSRRTVFDLNSIAEPAPAGYCLQLGAFSSAAGARKQAEAVSKLGLSPTVQPPRGHGLYRVTLEQISTRRELEKIEALLKKNHIEYHVLSSGG